MLSSTSGRATAFAAVLILLSPALAAAQQPADEATVNRRIDMGVAFLKKQQKADGFFSGTGAGAGKGFGVGYSSLAGMTLIECGVPNTDPGLKRAAAIVRAAAYEIDDTYELALAILFLDRMKDKNDKRVIQLLAGRLISAQMPSGGWGYKTHKYPEVSVLQLVAALRKLSGPDAATLDVGKLKLSVPDNMRRLAVWDDTAGKLNADPANKRHDLYDATTDNSNTHFAMIGLWAARKYDIPVDRTFALVARRFRTSQGQSGSWAYDFNRNGADGGYQHTCIALLGVAIGHVVSPPGVAPEADQVIIKAFTSLARGVGEPVGDTTNRPTVKDVGGLYYLWAMERIAVLYDIQKLGNKDWYKWGAEILVCHQFADGSWGDEGGYPGQTPIANTCLSLLFLKRANLTPDLSKKLIVNTSALVAKVDPKPEPKVEPPPPSPKVEEPPPSPKVEEPPPTPKVEEPKPAPPAPKVETPAPAAETPAPAPKQSNALLWVILGVALVAVLGALIGFVVMKKKQAAEEAAEAAAAKKAKKAKKAGETTKPAAKGEATKKPKAKAELDEDE